MAWPADEIWYPYRPSIPLLVLPPSLFELNIMLDSSCETHTIADSDVQSHPSSHALCMSSPSRHCIYLNQESIQNKNDSFLLSTRMACLWPSMNIPFSHMMVPYLAWSPWCSSICCLYAPKYWDSKSHYLHKHQWFIYPAAELITSIMNFWCLRQPLMYLNQNIAKKQRPPLAVSLLGHREHPHFKNTFVQLMM